MIYSENHPDPFQRHRGRYAVWVAVVVACGLASRSAWLGLPPFFAKYAGDALWALMIFVGFGFLMPSRSTMAVAGLAAVVCGVVECSQLYHAPWIDAIRRTWFGRMTLGNAFGWSDLMAYVVGIAAGTVAEWSLCGHRKYSPA